MSKQRTTRTDRRHDGPDFGPAPSAATMFDRAPPHSLEAEKGVLGSMMVHPPVIDEVVLVAKAEHFYNPIHGKIFAAIKALNDKNKYIDVTLLGDALKKAGDYDAIGGLEYLVELGEAVPTATNAVYYAEIVVDHWTARELLTASMETIRDVNGEAGEEHGDMQHVVERAEQRVFAISEVKSESHTTDMGDTLYAWMLDFEKRKEGQSSGTPTGFDVIDQRIGGLRGGELTIVAARPSMGKSAFAMNLAYKLAALRAKSVLFVTLEMSRIELAERLLACAANVHLTRLKNVWLSQHERRCVIETSSELSQIKLHIDEAPSRTVSEIAAVCRRMKRKSGLDAVFVDYLQLIEADNPRDPREQQVSKMSRRLKTLARELNIPIVCLSQLNREAEKSGDNKPRLSHLRESGAIEQDADNVVFVHRPSYYMAEGKPRDDAKNEAEIIWAKVRNGETGTDKLKWLGEYQRFEDHTESGLPT